MQYNSNIILNAISNIAIHLKILIKLIFLVSFLYHAQNNWIPGISGNQAQTLRAEKIVIISNEKNEHGLVVAT